MLDAVVVSLLVYADPFLLAEEFGDGDGFLAWCLLGEFGVGGTNGVDHLVETAECVVYVALGIWSEDEHVETC